ncbi:MAG: type II secretion system protein M [Candidatus Margulisbacteria bacterium]|nr:type II secretion system protein M [Candidatus Margulisiibacteriota bacterium]
MKFKLSNRERWLIFMTVVMVVLYAFYQFFLSGIFDDISVSSGKLNNLRTELSLTQSKAKILERLELSPLKKLRSLKGREEQTMEALRYISGIISRLGLNLNSVQPSASESVVGSAKAVTILLNMNGSYDQIYRFIKELEQLPILIIAESINLTRTDSGIAIAISLFVYY